MSSTLALFETVNNSASEAVVSKATAICTKMQKDGKSAILVNNVNRIAGGWRVSARVNLSFVSKCIIKKSSIGVDTHAYFTFVVKDEDLNETSKEILSKYDSELSELESKLENGSFEGVEIEDVFIDNGSIVLPAKAGFAYPTVEVKSFLALKVEYVEAENAYHKVTSALCGEPLQFSINSGGVLFVSEDDFLASFESSPSGEVKEEEKQMERKGRKRP